LDKAISVVAQPNDPAGLLASLAVRLSGRPQDVDVLIAQMPADWDREMLKFTPPRRSEY
jgi:hypothetical protein